jgi:hypothetical protein
MTDNITVNSEYDAFKDPLHPAGNPCSICGTEYEDDDWGVMGWVGILPISFCPTCEQGIFNMVYQLTPNERLVELIEEKLDEISPGTELDTSYSVETDID